MMLPRVAGALVACIVFLCGLTGRGMAAASAWRPVSAADFACDASAFSEATGAVIVFREIVIDDDVDGARLDYYVRIKVVDQQGVDALAKMEVPYTRGQRVRNLAARVVKPDGTTHDVANEGFFSREVVRVGREALSVRAFAFPSLEPGCIAEYRYRVYTSDPLFGMLIRLDDERSPLLLETVRVRGFSTGIPGMGIQMLWSPGVDTTKKGEDKAGFYCFEFRNVAVVKPEPFGPPEEMVHPWFAYYFTFSLGVPQIYWSYVGGELGEIAKTYLKPHKKLRAAAEQIVGDASSTDEKLKRLYDYCRTRIKNLSFDMSGYAPGEIEKLKKNRNALDIYTNGYGTREEINLLFGALVRSLGADCSVACCNDRSLTTFDFMRTMRSTLPDLVVAIEIGKWNFYDPGSLYVPMGRLMWTNEGTAVMVAKEDMWQIVETPRAGAADSKTRRTARLRLDEAGTLEGDIEIEMSGHDSISAKHLYDSKSESERVQLVTDDLRRRLGNAEVSDCAVLNAADPDAPITIKCHVRVEGYAEVAGDRLFVQPSFFQKGESPVFPNEKRRGDIYFPYLSTEEDEVAIELPAGFEREVPSLPASTHFADRISYVPRIEYRSDPHGLVYRREFTRDLISIGSGAYRFIKEVFDHVHREDAFTVTLQRSVERAAGPAGNTVAVEEPARTP